MCHGSFKMNAMLKMKPLVAAVCLVWGLTACSEKTESKAEDKEKDKTKIESF